jgi:8-oxo-dGTP pyrophosphatase MutT (NUDIX family)
MLVRSILGRVGPLITFYRRVFHRNFRGVLIALACKGEVLCVQHRYQPRGRLEMVGGGCKAANPALDIFREAKQELDLALDTERLILLGPLVMERPHRTTLHLFGYVLTDTEKATIRAHGPEIEALYWRRIDPDDPELGLGARTTLRRLVSRSATVTAVSSAPASAS